MRNPFVGEGDTSFDASNKLPLELTAEFETRVFPSEHLAKPQVKKIPKSSVALVFRGKANNILVVSRKKPDVLSMEEFKKGWTNYRGEERTKKVLEKTTDIISVPKEVRRAYVKGLEADIKKFTDFLVNELSPTANAFETAVDHSEQMLKLITNSDQDMSQAGTLRAMLRDAMQMRALFFISDAMKLTDAQVSILLEKYFKPKDIHVHPSVAQRQAQPAQKAPVEKQTPRLRVKERPTE